MFNENVGFVTVRSSSTRLPGKCFLRLGKLDVISHVIKRARNYNLIPIVCTSDSKDDDKIVEIGSPTVKGAKVEAELIKNGKNRTVLIFKKRRRKNSRRKNGHRQLYSLIKIKKIYSKDGSILEEAKKDIKKVEKKETKTKIK